MTLRELTTACWLEGAYQVRLRWPVRPYNRSEWLDAHWTLIRAFLRAS
jgi:hypothetical protein